MLVLAMFMFLVLFLLLVLLRSDAVTLLHLAEAERVGHEGLVRRLLLLLDSKERILTDLRRSVSGGVGVLSSNEVLVGGSDLLHGWLDLVTKYVWRSTHLLVFVGREDLVHPFLAEEVIF